MHCPLLLMRPWAGCASRKRDKGRNARANLYDNVVIHSMQLFMSCRHHAAGKPYAFVVSGARFYTLSVTRPALGHPFRRMDVKHLFARTGVYFVLQQYFDLCGNSDVRYVHSTSSNVALAVATSPSCRETTRLTHHISGNQKHARKGRHD